MFVGQEGSEETADQTSLGVCFGQLVEAGCTRHYHGSAARYIKYTISKTTVAPNASIASLNHLLLTYLHCNSSKSLFRAQASATVIVRKWGKFYRNRATHRGWSWTSCHSPCRGQGGLGYHSEIWRGSGQMQRSQQRPQLQSLFTRKEANRTSPRVYEVSKTLVN